jgi:hypothetical protein
MTDPEAAGQLLNYKACQEVFARELTALRDEINSNI